MNSLFITSTLDKLISRNILLSKWRELWPEDGEKPSEKCTEQWMLLGEIDEIKNCVAEPLELSVRKELWKVPAAILGVFVGSR